jgi:dihydrolipoamide dehydrogenase
VAQYDVVVIGSGPGGYVAAIHAARSGLETAIVEKDETERLGGTCLLRGCIPTKAMLYTAELVEKFGHAEDFGVAPEGGASVDLEKMDDYRSRVVAKNANGVKYLMRKNGIDVHFGHGRLTEEGNVRVTAEDGAETTLETDNVILATGSACRDLPFLPVDHERVLNSDDLSQGQYMPEHLVVLGAGAVGTEFASVYLRWGAEVTLVEMQDRILPIEDEEVSRAIQKSLERQGMRVETGTKLTDAEVGDDGVTVTLESADGSETLEASHILVAVGRRAVTDDVGLEHTDVVVDERGFVEVDEFMRTAHDGVYAIGDILETPWLAHVASAEGIVAVDTICDADPHPIHYGRIPNCTYCSPEVASVGLTEAQALEQGYDVRVGTFPFSAIGKAAIYGQTDGFVKIVSEKKYDELLGLHIVGPKATELITEGTVAMELETTIQELVHTIHPHPTLAEAVGEAAHVTIGEPIHI